MRKLRLRERRDGPGSGLPPTLAYRARLLGPLWHLVGVAMLGLQFLGLLSYVPALDLARHKTVSPWFQVFFFFLTFLLKKITQLILETILIKKSNIMDDNS